MKQKQNRQTKRRQQTKSLLTAAGQYKTVKPITLIIIIITTIDCCLATNVGGVTKCLRAIFNSSIFPQLLTTSP